MDDYVPEGSAALHMFQINLNFPKSNMEAKRMWKISCSSSTAGESCLCGVTLV